jgi:hypothetical protein
VRAGLWEERGENGAIGRHHRAYFIKPVKLLLPFLVRTAMSTTRETIPMRVPVSELNSRHAALHAAMLSRLEETASRENHGLIYMLLGWEHLAACAATNYLIEFVRLEHPHRWPYLLPWVVWVVVALATVRLVRGRVPEGQSPLGVILFRT